MVQSLYDGGDAVFELQTIERHDTVEELPFAAERQYARNPAKDGCQHRVTAMLSAKNENWRVLAHILAKLVMSWTL